jgi:hypothetical protein
VWVRVSRSAVKVTDPDGYFWEVRVSRVAAPRWKPGGYDAGGFRFGSHSYSRQARVGVGAIFAVVDFLVLDLLWPLLRFFIELPFAVVRGRRSQAYRVEARTFFPKRETYLWTTTEDHVERVAQQVIVGLKLGEFARPIGAVFVGGA